MPLPTPPRSAVRTAFLLGGVLLVGGLIVLAMDLHEYAGAREFPGVVKEHHSEFPPEPGSAVVNFWLDGVFYFDTIETAPLTNFAAGEQVTLFFAPNAGRRLQVKGFWQQFWVPALALGVGVPVLAFAFWGRARRRRGPLPDAKPVVLPPFSRRAP
jgi:hypothetical protein